MTSMQARDQRCGHQEPWPAGAGLLTDGGHRRIALDPAPESTRTARDFTIETLHGWRLDALIQDTVMVVSELVANAIRHGTVRAQDAVVTAEAQVELSWCYQASRLICTVTDRSCKPPLLATADFDAESGRGHLERVPHGQVKRGQVKRGCRRPAERPASGPRLRQLANARRAGAAAARSVARQRMAPHTMYV